MMDMSRKQAEFFTLLILICTVTAALILVIDFQIKGAILEESNRLRRMIDGQETAAANGSRPDNHHHNDPDYPADLVRGRDAGLEKASPIQAGNGQGKPSRAKRPQPRGNDGPGSLQD
jgi:hypothetical protein